MLKLLTILLKIKACIKRRNPAKVIFIAGENKLSMDIGINSLEKSSVKPVLIDTGKSK